jgi:hypothetical protein
MQRREREISRKAENMHNDLRVTIARQNIEIQRLQVETAVIDCSLIVTTRKCKLVITTPTVTAVLAMLMCHQRGVPFCSRLSACWMRQAQLTLSEIGYF